MKKIFLCNLLFLTITINAQNLYNSVVLNQIDGKNFTILTNEIDSITFDESNSQIVWSKDTLYKTLLSNLNSTTFETFKLPDVLVKTDDIGNWTEMRISLNGSVLMLKENENNNIPKELMLILPSEDLEVMYSYIVFDEDGMPKSITINECVIFVDAYYDGYIDLTIAYNDTIAYSVDSVLFNSALDSHMIPITRAWTENNWQRNLVGIVELASGAASVVGGALLVTGSILSEAGTVGASTPISIPGIIAGTLTIEGGRRTFASGWDKLFTPGNNSSTIGETIYYQGAGEIIGNILPEYIPNQYWPYLKDPNYSGQLTKAGWINFFIGLTTGIIDSQWGRTVTWENIRQYYQGKVITGINKYITTNSAIVRGYIDPNITHSLLDGSKVENEYGIIIFSSNDGTDRQIQKETNGAGGMIEYIFKNLKPATNYNYRTYYIDKTNGISLLGDVNSFKTILEPVEITKLEMTNATYYPNHYTYNNKQYSFRYNCTTYVTLKDDTNVEDWGYVYIDPDGSLSELISLHQYRNTVGDPRYAYCRNESNSTVKLKGYIKYIDDDEIYYGEEQEFPIAYPEESSITMNSCTFQGTENNVLYEGKTYKYKSTYRYIFSAMGAYWLKVRTDERGNGWNNWTDIPNYTMSPIDGNKANALTVNYYYDDKTFSGDFDVYLKATDATHFKEFATADYVTYTHSNNQFIGCTYHSVSYPTSLQKVQDESDIEEQVYNIIINKVSNY